MRLLDEHELYLVGGGVDPQPDPTPDDEVIVTGKRIRKRETQDDSAPWLIMYSVDHDHDTSGFDRLDDATNQTVSLEVPDEQKIEVQVNIDRPLTAEEKAALAEFMANIEAIDAAIADLSDNAILTLPNGSVVTGAELKDMWAKTDFTVNEIGTNYLNNSFRGEADYNHGNPQVSLNLDTVQRYGSQTGGMSFLVLHELGHMTLAGRSYLESAAPGGISTEEDLVNERIANDIARAIANAAGMPNFSNPSIIYSDSNPTFSEMPVIGPWVFPINL